MWHFFPYKSIVWKNIQNNFSYQNKIFINYIYNCVWADLTYTSYSISLILFAFNNYFEVWLFQFIKIKLFVIILLINGNLAEVSKAHDKLENRQNKGEIVLKIQA